MEPGRAIDLLEQQIAEAAEGLSAIAGLAPEFSLTEWRDRSESILRRALGQDHCLVKRFTDVRYSLSVATSSTTRSAWEGAKRSGVASAAGILRTAALELQELETNPSVKPDEAVRRPAGPSGVFLVHGHDARKEEVARVLQRLTGSDPTILHEHPSRGETIIEKFERHAGDQAFAVILATADDVGGKAGSADQQPRARQNVIFEMGFFIGALTRQKVAVLHDEGVELPSDYQGVIYIPLDGTGAWRVDLAKELRAAGIDADTNKL